MKNVKKNCQISFLILCLLFTVKNSNAQIISNHFFGANAWMPDSIGNARYNGKLHRNWGNVKNSNASLIRFGGIAPDENMPTDYQYIKMIDSIRANGMEPIIQVPFDNYRYTAQQAANIVRYINITRGRNVKYWIIANEPNLGYSYTNASQVANYFKPFSSAMKNVDPSILIIGPETAGFHQAIIEGLTTPGGPNDITGKDASGRYYLDIISFHTYPMGNGTSTRSELLTKLTEPNSLEDNLIYLNTRIVACNTFHNRTGTSALKTAITEANVNYLNPVSDNLYGIGSNSFLGGQFYAEILGMGIKYGVNFINLWSIIEGNSNTTNKGYLDNFTGNKKPLYHHFKLMAENFKGNNANCTTNQPNVKSFGCKDTQQTSVLILNEDLTNNYNYTVRLNTAGISGNNLLKINVDAGIANEYVSVIPNQSSVLLTFNSEGVLIKKCEYSLAVHAISNQTPTCTEFQASVVNAGNDVIMCMGNSTPLNATGAVTYTWKPSTGLSATNSANVIASPTVTTTYSVTGIDINGFVTTDAVLVTVSAPMTNAGNDVAICNGNLTPLNATGALTYTWEPSTGLSATNLASVMASPTVTTTYSVTGTDIHGCSAIDIVLVTINEPRTSAGNDVVLCNGSSTPLNATGANTYVWKPSTGLNATNMANVMANPPITTTYSVTGTDTYGCSSTDEVLVTISDSLIANAGPDITINFGSDTILNASGGSIYSWSPSTGLSNATIYNPIARPDVTTNYTLTVSSEFCPPAFDYITIFVDSMHNLTDLSTLNTEGNNLEIKIFPNPTTGKFTVELNKEISEEDNFEIELFNLTGQEVYRANSNFINGKEEIELAENIAQGTYILRVKEGNNISTKRIVLNK